MSLYMLDFGKEERERLWFPFLIGIIAFIYFASMAVKTYAWPFVSSDSADFLAASTIWMVPQTYGYPLYLLLGHFLNIFSGELAAKMTIILSSLPGAITIVFVYIIVKRLTNRVSIALVCSLVLLGAAVFLTESTVTKAYALIAMFITIGYYCYLRNWKYRTVIFLGLGTDIHVIVIAIAFFWMIADRRWSMWLTKPLLVYIVVGILPYVMVPILMATVNPPFLAGSFSISNVVHYWTSTSRTIIGMLSIYEFPKRLFEDGQIILMSFGLALIPLFTNIYRIMVKHVAVLIGTVLFVLWYVLTCLDAMTWPYLAMAAPSIVILVGLGLSKMHNWHCYVVATSAIILIIVNVIFMNANTIASTQKYSAEKYYQSLEALPNHSVVVTSPGPYSLGIFYAIANGKDLIPIIHTYTEHEALLGMVGYSDYLKGQDIVGEETIALVQSALSNHMLVYYIVSPGSPLERCFTLANSKEFTVPNKIMGLTGLLPDDKIEITRQ